VDAAGDVAKRVRTQAGRVAPKGGDKEDQRRNSEEETRHERMNPARENRGTVEAVIPTSARKQALVGCPRVTQWLRGRFDLQRSAAKPTSREACTVVRKSTRAPPIFLVLRQGSKTTGPRKRPTAKWNRVTNKGGTSADQKLWTSNQFPKRTTRGGNAKERAA
jgi:hypothetical protein